MANKANTAEMKYNQVAGLDIGNGCVKGQIRSNMSKDDACIDIQSVAVQKRTVDGEIRHDMSDADAIIGNIYNHMDATYESPCLEETGRYIIGNAAIISGNFQIMFDLGENERKSEQELSPILTLGCIAGKALQDAWQTTHTLPEIINVNVLVATLALPIQEFRTSREKYAALYAGNTHKVTIHTFYQDVVVNIIFDNVQVLAEGGAATFAIRAGGADLSKRLIADANAVSGQNITLSAEQVSGIRAIMGIDIGEGTTNFTFYDENGNLNAEASASIANGYGKVLEDSLAELHNAGHHYETRKDLQTFLNSDETRMTRAAEYAKVQSIVDGAIDDFAAQIAGVFQRQMKRHSAHINAIYVYGGGATAMKHALFPALVKKLRKLNAGIDAQPVLYFDNPDARFLNRDGLFLAANQILKLTGKTL